MSILIEILKAVGGCIADAFRLIVAGKDIYQREIAVSVVFLIAAFVMQLIAYHHDKRKGISTLFFTFGVIWFIGSCALYGRSYVLYQSEQKTQQINKEADKAVAVVPEYQIGRDNKTKTISQIDVYTTNGNNGYGHIQFADKNADIVFSDQAKKLKVEYNPLSIKILIPEKIKTTDKELSNILPGAKQ